MLLRFKLDPIHTVILFEEKVKTYNGLTLSGQYLGENFKITLEVT